MRARYEPESRRGKAHRATDVYWITKHIEREGLDAGIHNDTKVIAQEPACDTERPCRRQDECLPHKEEHGGDERVERGGEKTRTRLF